jgi:DNA-binding GntR family transcriptional regulator
MIWYASWRLRLATRLYTMLRYLIESIRVPLKESIEEGLRCRVSFAHHQRIQDLHEGLARALVDRDPNQASAMMSLHFDEALKAITGVSEGLGHAGQGVAS